jgi:hypothetical protein
MSSLIQTSEPDAIVYISSTNFFSHLTTILDTGGNRSTSNTITISTVSSFTFADGTVAKVIDTPYASLTVDAFAKVLHQFPFTYGGTTDAESITIEGKTIIRGNTHIYDSMYIANSISTSGTLDAPSIFIGPNSILTRPIIVSTVQSLGQLYTSSLYIPIDTLRSNGYILSNDLYSTMAGLGSTYVSSASFQSTVNGLGAYYISTASLVSTVRGLSNTYILRSNLTSTVMGLGSLGYVSRSHFLSTTATYRGGYIKGSNYTSTVAGLERSEYISHDQLSSTLNALGTIKLVSTASLVSTVVGLPVALNEADANESYVSTVAGLGTSKYISRQDLVSSVLGVSASNPPLLISTVNGLGTAGYISVSQLTSTVRGLSNTYIISANLYSTVGGFFDASYTTLFTSTVRGLGNSNYYISSLNPTVITVLSNERVQLVSTVVGLGQTYLSRGGLVSTVQRLSNIYIVSSNLISTVSGYDALNRSNLVSSVNTLASLPSPNSYVSSTQLFSTVSNVIESNDAVFAQVIANLGSAPYTYISSASFVSTVEGLSNTYILSSNLASTVTAYIDVNTSNIASTVDGLASLPFPNSYLSSTQLFSTVSNVIASNDAVFAEVIANLGSAPYTYISSASFVSTVEGLSNTYILSSNLASTVSGYIDVNTSNIASTVDGLASLPFPNSYLSSTQLFSTVSNVIASNEAAFTDVVGSLSNAPYSYIPFPSLISTVDGLSNTYILSSNLTSTVSAYIDVNTSNIASTVDGLASLPFPNSYLSSTQLFSTVSNVIASNQAAFTQVVASLSNAPYSYIPFPSLISTVDGLSNTYIVSSNLTSTVKAYTDTNTSNIASTVDGLASLPFPNSYLSSTQLFSTVSNVIASNQAAFTQVVASLSNAPYSYIPFTSLISTVDGLSNTYIVSSNLTSTVKAYTDTNTSNIVSTVNGLASLPFPNSYLSSTQLFSTVSNVIASNQAAFTQVVASLSNAPYSYIPFPSLTSTVGGLSNIYIVSSNLTSTVSEFGKTSVVTDSNLISTVNGLGSVQPEPYISSAQFIPSISNVIASNSVLFSLVTPGLSNAPYNYITTNALTSTTNGINTYCILPVHLTSTATGLANIYGSNLASTVNSLGSRADGYAIISSNTLYSGVSNVLASNATTFSQGMNTLASDPYFYIPATALLSTVTGLSTCNAVFDSIPPIVASLPPNLISTVDGLGRLTPNGYVSSTQLFSTVSNVIASNQAAIPQLVASLSNSPYTYIVVASLTSTVRGLGSLPGSYISSATLTASVSNLNESSKFSDQQLISSIANLGTKGYYSTPSLTSTLVGLGTFGYISLNSLLSTNTGLSNTYVSSNTVPTTFTTITSNTSNIIAIHFPSTVAGLGSLATPGGYGYISTPLNYTGIPRYLGIPTYISSFYAAGNIILRSTTLGVLTNLSNAGYPPTTQSTITIPVQDNSLLYVYTPSGIATSSNISARYDGIQMSNVYCSCNITSYSFYATDYYADATKLTNTSDRRLKYEILPLSNALDSVSRLEGVSYRMIGNTRQYIGFIAQDVEAVFPQLVFTNSSTKSIKYDSLGVVLLEAIKELNIQCDQLLSTMGQ